jgi:hypothetical protein
MIFTVYSTFARVLAAVTLLVAAMAILAQPCVGQTLVAVRISRAAGCTTPLLVGYGMIVANGSCIRYADTDPNWPYSGVIRVNETQPGIFHYAVCNNVNVCDSCSLVYAENMTLNTCRDPGRSFFQYSVFIGSPSTPAPGLPPPPPPPSTGVQMRARRWFGTNCGGALLTEVTAQSTGACRLQPSDKYGSILLANQYTNEYRVRYDCLNSGCSVGCATFNVRLNNDCQADSTHSFRIETAGSQLTLSGLLVFAAAIVFSI